MAITIHINHIELVDDGFGKMEPVISGRKITVHTIASMYILGNATIEWIAENFDLTFAQIHAALSYYYDHQAQIDAEIADAESLAQSVGTPAHDVIAKLRDKKMTDT